MAMDLRQYLAYRTEMMLRMERDVLKMNNMMADEVRNPQLKEIFRQHADPILRQISNLEQVVSRLGSGVEQHEGLMERMQEALGMAGTDTGTHVTQAMMREHKMFMEMNPPQQLIDIHNALSGDKMKHMEMASYSGMITLARQLGENDIMTMFQQNMQDEQQMCGKLEGILPTLLLDMGTGRMAA